MCSARSLLAGGAGKRYAAALSLVSGFLVLIHIWLVHRATPQVWITVWNACTRVIVITSAGWLTAEITRLTRNLRRLVEHRTAKWKAEAERHQVTSLRLAETLERRRQVEEVLQTHACILEKMAEGMVATDPQGIIQMTNPAADRLMGYATGELSGKHITLLSGLSADETARN